MLNKIIHFSLQNRILVLVASVLLLIGGTYTAFHTEVDVFPDLNAPTVVIMTEANGMAAEEVEQLVTFPVETAVNGATHVRRVRSSSTNGFSVVWVEFEWDTDIYLARQIVSEKLSLVSEELPENVGKPTMGPQSSILGELLIIGLTSDTTSMLDLRTLADWTIRPRLLSTGGVAQVAVLGGDIKEYQVLLDPARMKHYNVTLAEVMNVTRNMNQNANGGVIYEYGNEYIVRGVLSSHDVDQLSRSVIKTVEGVPVTLEDIADVKIGSQEPKLGTASERGKPAVLLTVTKQPKTGTIELTEQLEAALKDLQKNLPADVHVSTDIFRQSRFIESSIGNVKDSLYEGAVFVVIVLFLFLANVRTTVISLVTLPLSLIVSILTLHYMGLTINTMSLGGMAIAIGSLVDDAIVDVENVWKHLRENRLLPEGERKSVIEVVFNASKEVRMPILNSTLIIVVSFVPLFFLTGMEGRMLVPLGIAFIMGHRAEELLMSIPEIQTVARKTGRAELDEHALGVNVSEIEAPFELKDRSRQELVADVRAKLSTITGANIEIGQPISHRIDAMLSGTKANIAIKLFGNDLNKMFAIGNQIKDAISSVEGIADLNVEQQIERPQLKIVPKREMLAKFGISLPEFAEFVSVNMAGEVVSQVYEEGKAFNLIVRTKDEVRDEMEKVRNLMIDTGDGQKIPVNYVADVVSAMGPNTISRENVKRKIVISANTSGRDLRSVVNDIQERIDAQIKLPEGYHVEYGGQFESEQAASRTLMLTSFMSIVVIFLLLYTQFKNAAQSGVILLNLPLALIGGVFALMITTGEISIPAIIGFISLFGIATRNGMLLISHYNMLREEGMDLKESILHGSLDRLNPILMTALSSALALIPLAFRGDLPGNEIQSPMAKVILGGLLTSTFLNAFIIPIVYELMNRKKK